MFSRYFKMPDDFENTIYLSLVQQALALETGVEYWRSIKPLCMGTLYWQLNDNWPVASWSTMDYTGSWKAAHYAARRFFAPVMLTARKAEDKIAVFGVNDSVSPVSGELSVEFHNILSGEVTLLMKEKHTLPTDKAVCCAELPCPQEENSGFFRIVFDGDVFVEKEFFPREYKYYQLPEAQIRTDIVKTAKGFEVALSADNYAFFVFVSLSDTLCRFSDNLLTLYPGKAVVLTAETEQELSLEEFSAQLDVRDLRRTYNT